jgi:hypothetical protein
MAVLARQPLNHISREEQMKEEKKETKQEIIVFDEGIDMDGFIDPLSSCCFSLFMPLRN